MSSSISPLFAVHAEQFHNAGMYAEALELCLRGIEIYPHYPSAYVLTARTMWALGNVADAKEFIVNAVSHFPVHPALLRLEQELFGLVPASLPTTSHPETESDTHGLSLDNENCIQEQKFLTALEPSPSQHTESHPGREDDVPHDSGIASEDKDIPEAIDIIQSEIDDVQPEIDDSPFETQASQPAIEDNQREEVISDLVVPSESDLSDAPDKYVEKYTPLRIIEMTNVSHAFLPLLKASSMNLIPGLDFTPLKFQNGHSPKKNGILPAAPPFPRFRERIPVITPVIPKQEEKILRSTEHLVIEHTSAPPTEDSHKLTPLEELAARLEKVRIPATYEEITHTHTTELVPAMVTETMARIYEKQGAFPEAIKAYQILARRTPEKLEFYEERIREVQERMMEEG